MLTNYKNIYWINGRINRLNYFFQMVIFNVLAFLFSFTGTLLLYSPESSAFSLFLGVISALLTIGCSWVLITLTVKRFHDLNLTGWSILIIFGLILIGINYPQSNNWIQFILFLISLYLILKKGSIGRNKYGSDPLSDPLKNPNLKREK